MSHVVIGTALVLLTFAIAGFGVYANIDSSTRLARVSYVSGNLERQVGVVQDFMNDRREVPTEADLGSLVATYFTRPSMADLTFSYAQFGSRGYACATVAASAPGWEGAFNKIVSDRPAWFVSGTCGDSDAAISTTRVLSAGA